MFFNTQMLPALLITHTHSGFQNKGKNIQYPFKSTKKLQELWIYRPGQNGKENTLISNNKVNHQSSCLWVTAV